MIQNGFDTGFRMGAKLAVLEAISSVFITAVLHRDELGDDKKDDSKIVDMDGIENEIVRLQNRLREAVPELKIATNLFK